MLELKRTSNRVNNYRVKEHALQLLSHSLQLRDGTCTAVELPLGPHFIFPALGHFRFIFRASLLAQLVKNLPAMQETPVLLLGQEDPLEKESVQFSRSVVSDSL